MSMLKPPHPGLGLKDELEYLGLSVAQAAQALGVTRSQLYRVLAGKSAISPEMALRIETVIGGRAAHWLKLQAAYDMALLKRENASIFASLKPVVASDFQPSAI